MARCKFCNKSGKLKEIGPDIVLCEQQDCHRFSLVASLPKELTPKTEKDEK